MPDIEPPWSAQLPERDGTSRADSPNSFYTARTTELRRTRPASSPWLPMLKLAQQANHEVVVYLGGELSFRGLVADDREIGGFNFQETHPESVYEDLDRITLLPKSGSTAGTAVVRVPRWHVVLLSKIVALTEVNR